MSSFSPSIEEFNQLSVQNQQIIISNHLKNKENGDEKERIAKIKNLLDYLNEKNDHGNKNLFLITYQNKEKSLEEVIYQVKDIELSYQTTEVLHAKIQFNSTELENHLSNFETVLLDLKYPSSLFDDIYKQSLNLKQKISKGTRIIISIFISGISKTSMKFRNDKNIEIIKLDKKVTEITGEKLKFRKPKSGGSFSGCSSLTQITIPSSVILIGSAAFNGCSSLTQITIPSSVTSIGFAAFKGCSSLTQITIPSSVTSIEYYSFKGCSLLSQITIPSSVTSIGDYAFYGCSSLTQITIPSSVTSIGNLTFYGCSLLAQIKIPSSVISIGDYAFSECSSLTQIKIPSSVTSIGNGAFSECSSLTRVSIPSSVTSFGVNIFNGIKTLEITGNINFVPNGLFSGCSSLTQITIPSSVSSIEEGAFNGCSSLTQVPVPFSVKGFTSNFTECFSNKNLEEALKSIFISMNNKRNVILTGSEGSGMSQVVKWVAQFYNMFNSNKSNDEFFCVCNKETKFSDLIGVFNPLQDMHLEQNQIIFRPGLLISAIQQGRCVVFDSINEASPALIERLTDSFGENSSIR